MTTVSLIVNGDEKSAEKEQISDGDLNMVSGFKDLCVGKMDSIALKENKSDNFQIEVKNALTGVMNNEEKKFENELNYLKDLIASHLDLIQQQSEQLTIKDRLISKLKNENETLNMRLIRMDRRVNLHLNRRDASPEDDQSLSKGGSLQSHCGGAGGAKEGVLEERKRIRRQSCESNATVDSRKSLVLSFQSKKKSDKRLKKDDGDCLSPTKSSKLCSKELYYTSIGEQECRWGSEPCQLKQPISQLEVPSWRMKVFSSSYTMEGTENLMDEVFNRRHSRLSQDEKRRKRWDVQMIREMRHTEKLRQRERARREGTSGQLRDDIESFWPKPNRQTRLIVTKQVPVSVLGLTLTAQPVKDFSYSSYRQLDSKSYKILRKPRR